MTFIELLLVVYVVILYTKDWLAKKVEYYLWNLESQPNRQVVERNSCGIVHMTAVWEIVPQE